ncbi:hypothetical protein ACQ86D_48895 [Streptomyces galilaeus]
MTVLFEGCPTRKSAAFHDRLRESVNERHFPGLHSVLEDYVLIDYGDRFGFGIEQILQSAPTTRPGPRPGS